MKIFAFVFLSLLLVSGKHSFAETISEEDYQKKIEQGEIDRINYWRNALNNINEEDSSGKVIGKTGLALRGIGDLEKYKYYLEEAAVIKREIIQIISNIPGHAEYYRDRINETYERSGKSSEFSREQSWSFQTLEQLPSPETVRVLGEFLYDERNEFVEDPELSADANDQKMIMSRTNAMHAMRALVKLIDNPPVPSTTRPRKADLNPWRLWYEQVKAGTRTIRFKGDPQEYSLEGPVREPKHGPTTNRPAKRDAADGTLTGEQATGFTPFRMILTGMAVLLCLWASWRCWKMRPGAA